jgi:chromosome condensin MukBEF ATPase and DNA-binding subunit MukB
MKLINKINNRIGKEIEDFRSVVDIHSFVFGMGICSAVLLIATFIGKYLGMLLS